LAITIAVRKTRSQFHCRALTNGAALFACQQRRTRRFGNEIRWSTHLGFISTRKYHRFRRVLWCLGSEWVRPAESFSIEMDAEMDTEMGDPVTTRHLRQPNERRKAALLLLSWLRNLAVPVRTRQLPPGGRSAAQMQPEASTQKGLRNFTGNRSPAPLALSQKNVPAQRPDAQWIPFEAISAGADAG